MDTDGSDATNLTSDPGFDNEPAWSPDGSAIAFGTGRDGNAEVYVMDSDGGNPENLTNDPAPTASPPGRPDPRSHRHLATEGLHPPARASRLAPAGWSPTLMRTYVRMSHPAYIREKAREMRTERRLSIDEIAERLGAAEDDDLLLGLGPAAGAPAAPESASRERRELSQVPAAARRRPTTTGSARVRFACVRSDVP